MQPSPPPPASAGWAGAASAFHALRQMLTPVLLVLEPTGHAPLVIDLRDATYVWATPLSEFPPRPAEVHVGTHALDGDDSRLLARGERGADPLLWLIGLHAFPGRASWLRPGDRYRLKRWPDLDAAPPTPERARAIRVLAGGLMGVDRLALKAGIELDQAHAIVNALSLMGALHRVEGKGGAPVVPPAGDYDPPARVRGRHVRRGG